MVLMEVKRMADDITKRQHTEIYGQLFSILCTNKPQLLRFVTGRGIRWKASPLMANCAEYQHQDKTDLSKHGETPLDYSEQYIDTISQR